MNFEDEINNLEELFFNDDYIIKIGNKPILFTAPHTMIQKKQDGSIKLEEPYTKAIAMYLNKHCNTSYLIKIKDTGLDSNRDNNDAFKKELIEIINKNQIKMVIDLHGASPKREFVVEFGTLDNLTAKKETIKKLEDSFKRKGVLNIAYNEPFKGGAITQYVHKLTKAEVIQIEINGKYRRPDDLDKLKLICEALVEFVKEF